MMILKRDHLARLFALSVCVLLYKARLLLAFLSLFHLAKEETFHLIRIEMMLPSFTLTFFLLSPVFYSSGALYLSCPPRFDLKSIGEATPPLPSD